MRKLKVKASKSLARLAVVGGLVRSEEALRDKTRPNIKSDRLSILGRDEIRTLSSDKELNSNH
jgi:hypothetical protein